MSETLEWALFNVEAVHHIHADQCLCGFKSSVSRDRTKHIMDAAITAAKPHLLAQGWDAAVSSLEYPDGTKVEVSENINPYRSGT
jgi:hypothetical protein